MNGSFSGRRLTYERTDDTEDFLDVFFGAERFVAARFGVDFAVLVAFLVAIVTVYNACANVKHYLQ